MALAGTGEPPAGKPETRQRRRRERARLTGELDAIEIAVGLRWESERQRDAA